MNTNTVSPERVLECGALEILAPLLAQATEKMIILAASNIRRLSEDLASCDYSLLNDTKAYAESYAKYLTIILDYTQLEELGLGWGPCKQPESNEFITKLAHSLRDNIEWMRNVKRIT